MNKHISNMFKALVLRHAERSRSMFKMNIIIVKCSDESYYTGITNDIERRIEEHNFGESPDSYTAIRRPVKLMFFETFNDFSIAEQWEKRIKGWSRRKKEALIESNWEKLKEYSVCQNKTNFSNFKKENE